jgi:hypothetical protein
MLEFATLTAIGARVDYGGGRWNGLWIFRNWDMVVVFTEVVKP